MYNSMNGNNIYSAFFFYLLLVILLVFLLQVCLLVSDAMINFASPTLQQSLFLVVIIESFSVFRSEAGESVEDEKTKNKSKPVLLILLTLVITH